MKSFKKKQHILGEAIPEHRILAIWRWKVIYIHQRPGKNILTLLKPWLTCSPFTSLEQVIPESSF